MQNVNMEWRNEAIFACRIYDIGRLVDYPAADFIDKYKALFSRYYDVDAIIGILKNDEKYADISKKLQQAYELSSMEMDKDHKRMANNKKLKSVFNRVSLSEQSKESSNFYPFKPLHPDNVFVRNEQKCGDVKNFAQKFEDEIKKLEKNSPATVEEFLIVFDGILQKYTWCIAASEYEGEDVALYDYSKSAEAILQCIIDAQHKKKFCLVLGNFSGIQKYIFNVANTNESGVAKRLRARSFYVDLLIRVMAKYIVDKYKLTRANILMQTGGKFLLLLPNNEAMNSELKEIKAYFEKHLYEEFKGTISVNMAWLELDEKGLSDYNSSMYELNQIIKVQKNRAFKSVLCTEEGWNEDAFVIYDKLDNIHVCKSCNSNLTTKDFEYCRQCNDNKKMGEKLPGAKYIVYRKNIDESKKKHTFNVLDEYYVELTSQLPEDKVELIEALNQDEFGEIHYNYPIVCKHMVNRLPSDEHGKVKSFSEMAQAAKGMKKLAVLKADVDVLGYLFADGMRVKNKNYGTISRINTMSRMLEMFFSGYVHKILSSKKEYEDVYSVFSGGDDLLLIGPWNVMPELALEVRETFQKFVDDNGDITLSAAISIFGPKEHIAFMADYAEEELDRAKNEILAEIHNKSRNSVCFLNEILSWDDFKEQKEIVDRMQLLIGKSVSSGMLYRLAKYSDMYKQYVASGRNEGLMFRPYLNYDIKRNYDKIRNLEEWFKAYIKDMMNKKYTQNEINKNLFYAKLTTKWAMNVTRRR